VPVEHDVGRLDVAVDMLLPVDEVERLGDLEQPAAQQARRHRPELAGRPGHHPVLQAPAPEVLHHHVRLPGQRPRVDHLHDMGMAQPHQRPDLAREAIQELRARRGIIAWAGELQDDVSLQVAIMGEVNTPHVPLTYTPQHPVAALGDFHSHPVAAPGCHGSNPLVEFRLREMAVDHRHPIRGRLS
jgi:hypothetical protein